MMRVIIAVLLALAGLLTGCAPSPSTSELCATRADCPRGACVLGVCTVNAGATNAFLADAKPSTRTGAPPEYWLNERVKDGDFRLQFAPITRVSGRVLWGGQPLDAQIVATSVDGIPGRPLTQSASTSADGQFEFPLASAATYRLTALPSDRALPPYTVTHAIPARLASVVLPFQYEPDALRSLRGRVISESPQGPLAVPGMQIRIFQDGRRASGVATTDESGRFTVLLAPDAGAPLEARVTPSSSQPAYPSVTLPISLHPTDDLEDITLGLLAGPTNATVRVLFEGAPVAGIRVDLHGTPGAGSVSLSGLTDADGRFVTPALEGTYTAAVKPRLGTEFASVTSEPFTVSVQPSPHENATTIHLSRRFSLYTVVTTANGDAVAGASVFVAPIHSEETLTAVATTSDDGTAALLLDRGPHRITVQPAAETAQPRQSVVVDVERSGTQEIQLDAPMAARGRVVDADDAPVPGAAIRLYARLAGPDGKLVLTEDGAPPILGEAITNEQGEVSMTLPSFSQ